MSTVRVFNESVFDSYASLQSFFLQSNAINEVLSRKDKVYSKVLSPLEPNLCFIWEVCQLLTFPYRWLTSTVLDIISKIAKVLGATGFAKQAKIASQYLDIGFDLYSENQTELFRIKDTRNGPNSDGQIVINTPFIPESQILDPRVKKRTFCEIHNGISFNHRLGICRGMRDWFLYLYLKTKDQFSDPRAHIDTLGRQFSNGGSIESTLLHSIFLRKGKLLGLKIGTQPAQSRDCQFASYLLWETSADWLSLSRDLSFDLGNLSEGAYGIGIPKHAVAYVKIHNTLGYFFDPNHDIIEINGPEQGEKLYQLVSDALQETGENLDAVANNIVTVMPYTLR
jgi:hypothetical protein